MDTKEQVTTLLTKIILIIINMSVTPKTLVLGYYNKRNHGDDLFKYILTECIDSTFEIRGIEELENCYTNWYANVILGCGDIVNSHFLSDKNLTLLHDMSKRGVSIIFFGIGIQYTSYIWSLDIGDVFYVRNKEDYKTLVNRYSNDYVRYTPDIVHILSDKAIINTSTSIKKIGVCLPYTWISGQLNNRIRGMIEKIVSVIKQVRDSFLDSVLYLIPFDTSENASNSDLVLNSILAQYLQVESVCHDAESMTDMDFVIAGRFHSVIKCIIHEIPFIALYSSEKIRKLSIELPWELCKMFIGMPVNYCFEPINVNTCMVTEALEHFIKNQNIIRRKIKACKASYNMMVKNAIEDFKEMLQDSPKRRSPPSFISGVDKFQLKKSTISSVLILTNQRTDFDKIMKGSKLTPTSDKSMSIRKRIVEEILWSITGDPYGIYYYGMMDNIFRFSLIDQISWTIDDYYLKYKSNTSANIINKNFHSIHRSGWQYVLDNIPDSNILIDTYVDKTFHWNSDFYKSKGIIPYKSPWVGFIHHTFSDYNNNYNCKELVQNRLFLQSLDSCKCIIVLSEYLKKELSEYITTTPIRVLTHPSETPIVSFNIERFHNNQNKKLINVGTWLRDMFAIYTITLPDVCQFEKCILKNKNSEAYFVPDNFLESIQDTQTIIYTNNDMCKSAFKNIQVKGIYEHLVKAFGSVTVIDYLTNDEYDSLLSDNIVFLNFVDASATNTVIECVMRNTPMIVNKIPAIVEILGEGYPLYYTSMYQVTRLLEDENLHLINTAYEYLCNLDKTRFSIEHFTREFLELLE